MYKALIRLARLMYILNHIHMLKLTRNRKYPKLITIELIKEDILLSLLIEIRNAEAIKRQLFFLLPK